MVEATELCAALEELIAIQYDKQYRTWRDTQIITAARNLAHRYRTETNSLPSQTSLCLKPPEAVSFEEGKVEDAFDSSEITSPDGVPLASFSESSAEVHYANYILELKDSDQSHVTYFSGYQERHPALPD